ncbi:SDR family NAD(P)-dependent oxidoreductase [Chitinophaga sp. RAB17]|uniref:SDR family NAD(P)-dependent oxidoreductase n=1 Tax=Chitinophaga sp. RAB17 TaxID=3233049 RepID=UPI003F8FC243
MILLQHKTAIVYGVSDSLGGAVARAFARAGAHVFLTGHRLAPVQKVADEIIAAGGLAEVAVVDALDQQAVNAHLDMVVAKTGSVDISFNLIGIEAKQNIPLLDMNPDDFVHPVKTAMRTHFITATAAGKQMSKQRSGAILTLTATPGGIGYPLVGGFGPACCAIESFVKGLASELGPNGVRVVNIRSAGSPDSHPFLDAINSGAPEVPAFLEKLKDDTMLKALPLMADIANTAVFLASEMAGKITGVTIDVTAGTTAALNYKMMTIPFLQ